MEIDDPVTNGNTDAVMTESTPPFTPSPPVPASRLSQLTESLKLEHQLLRVPFEHYKKTIRANHRYLEKEVTSVVSSVNKRRAPIFRSSVTRRCTTRRRDFQLNSHRKSKNSKVPWWSESATSTEQDMSRGDVYDSAAATDQLLNHQSKYSIFLFNHENASFTQLPHSVSSSLQQTYYNNLSDNRALLGGQGFNFGFGNNNVSTALPEEQVNFGYYNNSLNFGYDFNNLCT
ncbi:hypothetical protein F2Q70_00040896 [Brassica cretica]|uniref:Uncharacterized protein n=1 Tax=Brassica cretica TaxID=69181 RepID=A0A8S9KA87_BRACR|nr:hypothetical protein F2Q70_00040896 [Brassica cretica]